MRLTILTPTPPAPSEVLVPWPSAQRVAGRLATALQPPVPVLRTRGFLLGDRAGRIAAWYLGPPTAEPSRLEVTYAALARELAPLTRAITAPVRSDGLGVRVTMLGTADEPYADAGALCDELRRHATMNLAR